MFKIFDRVARKACRSRRQSGFPTGRLRGLAGLPGGTQAARHSRRGQTGDGKMVGPNLFFLEAPHRRAAGQAVSVSWVSVVSRRERCARRSARAMGSNPMKSTRAPRFLVSPFRFLELTEGFDWRNRGLSTLLPKCRSPFIVRREDAFPAEAAAGRFYHERRRRSVKSASAFRGTGERDACDGAKETWGGS